MGIPRFASWIFNNRSRKLTVPYVPKNVCSLSFDVNSIIHGCAQIVYNYGEWKNDQRVQTISEMTDEQLENELFKLITDTIFRIVEKVCPKDYLVLAVDGVAPLAKIQQQRGRRYRSTSVTNVNEVMRFDPNCITPGTEFMFRLDEYFKNWIENNIQNLPEKIFYSNHMVAGEGEQKIFDYVRSRELSGYGAHIIYGLDADLIILSLISRLKGVYLLREKSLEHNTFERLIAIDEVRDYLYDRMRTSTAVDDFAILSFFLGNDFIPTSPMFCGDMYDTIEYLLETYDKLGLSLTHSRDLFGHINIINFKKFLNMLMNDESDRLTRVFLYPPKLGFKTLELSVQSYIYHGKMKVILNKDEFQKNWYTKIFSPTLEKSEMAFQLPDSIYLKMFEPTKEKISNLVSDYINAFIWTYSYYKKGPIGINPNFFYVSGYAPLLTDVVEYFPKQLSLVDQQHLLGSVTRPTPPSGSLQDSVADGIRSGSLQDSDSKYRFTVLHQLLSVLPPKSIKIIPKELHQFYHPNSVIADMFPSKVCIDTEAKDMERLGVVRMSAIEPERLLELNLCISDDKMKKYESQKSMRFEKKMFKDMRQNNLDLLNKSQPMEKPCEVKHDTMSTKDIESIQSSDVVKSINLEKPKTKFIEEFERLKRIRRINDTNEKFK